MPFHDNGDGTYTDALLIDNGDGTVYARDLIDNRDGTLSVIFGPLSPAGVPAPAGLTVSTQRPGLTASSAD